MKLACRATMVVAILITPATAHAQDAVSSFDPVTGYRMSRYRGVVDRTSEGVTRIDVHRAAMLRNNTILIDVTPAEGGIRDENGASRLAVAHATIPGAHWFPEAGRGVLAPTIDAWFARRVRALSHGRADAPIMVFCLADCWMSWNAALRLKRAGYRQLYWFADGIDGWKQSGRQLVDTRPEPD